LVLLTNRQKALGAFIWQAAEQTLAIDWAAIAFIWPISRY